MLVRSSPGSLSLTRGYYLPRLRCLLPGCFWKGTTQEEQDTDERTWDILPGHVIAGCQAPEGPKRNSRGLAPKL